AALIPASVIAPAAIATSVRFMLQLLDLSPDGQSRPPRWRSRHIFGVFETFELWLLDRLGPVLHRHAPALRSSIGSRLTKSRRGRRIMKGYFALALAAAAGGFAATAVSGLYAATVKPIYVVMEIDEVTDADGFKSSFQRRDVRTAVEAMVEDGRYIVRTENAIALDGTPPKSFVIISFQ